MRSCNHECLTPAVGSAQSGNLHNLRIQIAKASLYCTTERLQEVSSLPIAYHYLPLCSSATNYAWPVLALLAMPWVHMNDKRNIISPAVQKLLAATIQPDMGTPTKLKSWRSSQVQTVGCWILQSLALCNGKALVAPTGVKIRWDHPRWHPKMFPSRKQASYKEPVKAYSLPIAWWQHVPSIRKKMCRVITDFIKSNDSQAALHNLQIVQMPRLHGMYTWTSLGLPLIHKAWTWRLEIFPKMVSRSQTSFLHEKAINMWGLYWCNISLQFYPTSHHTSLPLGVSLWHSLIRQESSSHKNVWTTTWQEINLSLTALTKHILSS